MRRQPERPTATRREVDTYDHDEVIAYYRRCRDDTSASAVAQMKVHAVPITTEMLDYLDAMRLRAIRHQAQRDDTVIAQRRELVRRRREESWVYFIAAPGRIKIGVSVDPAARALSLSLRWQDIVAVIEAGEAFERHLHKEFAAHRIGDTEWFHDCPEIRDYIDTYGEPFSAQHRAYKAPKRATRTNVTRDQAYGALLRAITSDTT